MSEQTRMATRELRWEQIQAAIADMLQEGTTPITMVEVARRCDIPRSSLSKEPVWKAAIASAEVERVRRRAEQLQQLRVGFLTPVLSEKPADEQRQVSIESIIYDLKRLLDQSSSESQIAYERGRKDAYAELPPAPGPVDGQLAEAFERGREAGRSEFSEDLNQAYERGLKDGRDNDASAAEAYERGRQAGFQEAASDAKGAYDRGRQMGRAELQVELKQSYDQGVKDGKAEAASDVMNAYDRGRRDGWEEGRRDASGGRSMFGFTVNKSNPDREWALAVLHASSAATPDQLRSSYRMLTKAFHPDRNPDVSPEFIRNLNRAKELLGF